MLCDNNRFSTAFLCILIKHRKVQGIYTPAKQRHWGNVMWYQHKLSNTYIGFTSTKQKKRWLKCNYCCFKYIETMKLEKSEYNFFVFRFLNASISSFTSRNIYSVDDFPGRPRRGSSEIFLNIASQCHKYCTMQFLKCAPLVM